VESMHKNCLAARKVPFQHYLHIPSDKFQEVSLSKFSNWLIDGVVENLYTILFGLPSELFYINININVISS